MNAEDRMLAIYNRRAEEANAFIGPVPKAASFDTFSRIAYLFRAGIIL